MQINNTIKELILYKHSKSYPKFLQICEECNVGEMALSIMIKAEEDFVKNCSPSRWSLSETCSYIKLAIQLQQFVLFKIISEENGSLTYSQLGTLLISKELQISLLACSVQIILFANDMLDVEDLNIWVYEVLEINSFHVFKILDFFQRVIHDFPTVILQHIAAIEKEIIECSIWKLESPIYSLLDLSSENVSLNSLSKPEKNMQSPLRLTQAFDNGRISNQLTQSETFTKDLLVKATTYNFRQITNQIKTKIIYLLHKKIYQNVYARVKKFAQYFNFPANIEIGIQKCFKYCMRMKCRLFVNRHIDQILMCCIYGVCKVEYDVVTFKSIIVAYRTIQPQQSAQIWKKVWMEDGEDGYDSIIVFYNRIFIDAIKQHLFAHSPIITIGRGAAVEFGSASDLQPIDSPSSKSRMLGLEMRVTMMEKVMPMQQHTPRTIKLYSFGNSPLSSLKYVSQISSAVVMRESCASKRLKFDSTDRDEAEGTTARFDN